MERFEAGSRGARNAASMLPFFALVLFIPPVILIFAKPVAIFGIPLIAAYLFTAWAIVIIASLLLAMRLGKPEKPSPPPDENG